MDHDREISRSLPPPANLTSAGNGLAEFEGLALSAVYVKGICLAVLSDAWKSIWNGIILLVEQKKWIGKCFLFSRASHCFLRGVVAGLCLLLTFLQGCSSNSRGDPDVVSSAGIIIPGVRCPDRIWFVGSVDPRKPEKLLHTFTIYNDTDQVIPIANIRADCGCVVTQAPPTEISAHGSAGVTVRFDVSSLPGAIQHAILVKLDTSPIAFLPLKVQGKVVPTPALISVPGMLDFGVFENDQKKTRIAQVSRYDGSPVRILGVTSDLAADTLDFQSSNMETVAKVSVTLSSRHLKPGNIPGSVIIKTDDPVYPSLSIPIKGKIVVGADAFLPSLLIESMRPGTEGEFLLVKSSVETTAQPTIRKLEYIGDPAIRVLPLSASGERHTCKGLRRGWILVAVSADAREGEVKRGIVRLYVDKNYTDPVEVPVIVLVR